MSTTTSLAARVRLTLARHPSLYWVAVAGCAGLLAWSTAAALAGPGAARAAWGTSQRVWVARGDIPVGAPIEAHPLDVPAAMVPTGALDDPAGLGEDAVAAGEIAAGEILVAHDVAGRGRWALVPPGWRAIAIPRTDATLDVVAGDRVDVHWAGATLAEGAIVVASGEHAVTIAVDADRAAGVATASVDPSLVLALVSAAR